MSRRDLVINIIIHIRKCLVKRDYPYRYKFAPNYSTYFFRIDQISSDHSVYWVQIGDKQVAINTYNPFDKLEVIKELIKYKIKNECTCKTTIQ